MTEREQQLAELHATEDRFVESLLETKNRVHGYPRSGGTGKKCWRQKEHDIEPLNQPANPLYPRW